MSYKTLVIDGISMIISKLFMKTFSLPSISKYEISFSLTQTSTFLAFMMSFFGASHCFKKQSILGLSNIHQHPSNYDFQQSLVDIYIYIYIYIFFDLSAHNILYVFDVVYNAFNPEHFGASLLLERKNFMSNLVLVMF
jgi:hypothetical protein